MRRTHSLLIACTLLLPFAAGADNLRLVTGNYPPYEYEEGGKIKGMAVEIITEALRRINHTVEIRVVPWARALREAEVGEADGVFAAVKTPEREALLAYSHEAILQLVVSLFVKKGSPIVYDGQLSKLAGARFGVVNQFSNGSYFDNAVKAGVLRNVDVVNDTAQNIRKLLGERIDVMVNNKYGALYFLKKENAQEQVVELAPEIDNSPSYLAFTKKRDLSRISEGFDRALAAMKKDGTYQRIVQQYDK